MAEPKSIFERMAAIVGELPAIGKQQKNQQQGFMFRGHDDVMNALNPLLSKHQVFVVPYVLERVTDQRTTKSGTIMYEVDLHVRYTFYGPLGDYVTASAWGEGTDSGDKATNKAMTMAFKNALAQSFAVSTEEHARFDTDGSTDEETVRKPASGSAGPAKQTRKKPEAKKAASGSAAGIDTTGGGHGNTVERDNQDVPESWSQFATKEQRQELFELKRELGVSDVRLMEILEHVTKQRTTAAIPAELFEKVMENLQLEAVPFA